MFVIQERLRHARVTQYASFLREKARTYCTYIGAISFEEKASSFEVHVFVASSSRRHKSPATASKVQHVTIIPDIYVIGPSQTSLIYLYADHSARNMWDGV